MASFQKVALIGKGLLGSAILDQLAQNGFTVTLLTRNASAVKGVPSGVTVTEVDYTHDSFVNALQGQDVVVAALHFSAIPVQKTIIDASIQAGVRRYIPNDWGSLTTDPAVRQLPFFQAFYDIQDYLKAKADAGLIEYTLFSVGCFFESMLEVPFLVDFANHSVRLHDDGQHAFSSTSVSGVGKAVVGALRAPAETKNRNIRVHETALTQAKVYQAAKRYSPPGTQWTETKIDAQREVDKVLQASGDIDALSFESVVFTWLKASLLSGRYRAVYEEPDNELVGLPLVSDEEIEKRLAAHFQRA